MLSYFLERRVCLERLERLECRNFLVRHVPPFVTDDELLYIGFGLIKFV